MSEARAVDPSTRFGQVGEDWGNLLLAEGELERDAEIFFEGEEPAHRYWVTRVIPYPGDASKRLYYYHRVPRWGHPPPKD